MLYNWKQDVSLTSYFTSTCWLWVMINNFKWNYLWKFMRDNFLHMLSTSLISKPTIYSTIYDFSSNPCLLLIRSLHLVVNPDFRFHVKLIVPRLDLVIIVSTFTQVTNFCTMWWEKIDNNQSTVRLGITPMINIVSSLFWKIPKNQ